MGTKGDISTLDVLSYGGKPIVPLVESYSGSRQSGLIQSDVSGGASRQRKKFYNTTYLYSAMFYLETPQQQDFIKMFFNDNEGKKFICHLAADRPIVEPYVVQVVSDWNDSERNAIDGKLSVTIEVFSVRDACLDNLVKGLYSCIGDETAPMVRGISQLAKVFL